MYRFYTSLLWVILCLSLSRLSAQTAYPSVGYKPDYVLILNSYDVNNEWAFLIERNFSSYFQGPKKVKVVTEYLEMSPQMDREAIRQKAEEIKEKYTSPNKLVLLLGEDAWIFYRTFFGQCWSQQPAIAVFTGNYTTSLDSYLSPAPASESERISLDDSRKGMNAVILQDKTYAQETVQLMHHLLPRLNSIALITDKRRISKVVEQEVKHTLRENFPQIRLINLHMGDYSTEQLRDTIQHLTPNTGILFHSWYLPNFEQSRSSNTNSMKLIIGRLTNSPVFTLYDAGVKEGMITGGHYSTIGSISTQLHQLTDRILTGEKASSLPIMAVPDAQSYLNYRNLSYLEIPSRLYPRDAIYYEKPVDNFEKNKVFILYIIIIVSLLAIIFSLLVQYKQRQLRNSQRLKEILERSNKLQAAFIANMSHEIRTPLNAIIGFSSLLSEPGLLTAEERQKSQQLLAENKDNLLQLINNILDLSQIESGNLEIKQETVCLRSTVSDIVNVLQSKYPDSASRISLTADIPECFILSDWKLLTQALNNLAETLLTYSRQAEIQIGYRPQPGEAYLYLTSTGGEIPEGKIRDTFDNFEKGIFNVQEAGVGLVLSQAIVKVLGGKIGFTSQSKHMFTFWLTLPMQQRKKKE